MHVQRIVDPLGWRGGGRDSSDIERCVGWVVQVFPTWKSALHSLSNCRLLAEQPRAINFTKVCRHACTCTMSLAPHEDAGVAGVRVCACV